MRFGPAVRLFLSEGYSWGSLDVFACGVGCVGVGGVGEEE